MSDKQALHPITDQSASSPVKIEAPRELPNVILVNTSLKKLKYHLGKFDNVVKKRITPNALTKGEWGFKHTKAVFQKEMIPFLKNLKDIFNVFDKDLLNEVTEVQTVFNQIEADVQQYHVLNLSLFRKQKGKKNGNIQEKCLLKLDMSGDPQEGLSLYKLKIAKSVISNIMEPSTCRGSNTSVAPSSSSIDLKLSKLSCGSRGTNLYSLSIRDMMTSSPICLLSKASKTKSWLWHRRLSHLNFGTINHLARHGLVRGLPILKFEKDHLCSACAMGKCKKQSHKPKFEDTNQEKLYLLHMVVCRPIRVARLQISQSPRGIFLNQSKYALESLKKYGIESCDPVDTLTVEKSKLDEDTQGKAIDPTHYHGMVDTLMYLTSSRPDLVYAIYADHTGYQDTRHSTSRSMQLLGDRLVSWSSKRQKALQYPVRKLNI
ncbi:integrase, catalytic region, zinc finger, CCHC-type containing protein [Tanacetum coccineum]